MNERPDRRCQRAPASRSIRRLAGNCRGRRYAAAPITGKRRTNDEQTTKSRCGVFMRIAVLDDDSAQADLVCQTLSAAGHVCHAYVAGRELVRQLRRQTFDLLVLDWNVPDMSGEEVLRWVRESLSERLPVLFMTNRGQESDITSILNKIGRAHV